MKGTQCWVGEPQSVARPLWPSISWRTKSAGRQSWRWYITRAGSRYLSSAGRDMIALLLLVSAAAAQRGHYIVDYQRLPLYQEFYLSPGVYRPLFPGRQDAVVQEGRSRDFDEQQPVAQALQQEQEKPAAVQDQPVVQERHHAVQQQQHAVQQQQYVVQQQQNVVQDQPVVQEQQHAVQQQQHAVQQQQQAVQEQQQTVQQRQQAVQQQQHAVQQQQQAVQERQQAVQQQQHADQQQQLAVQQQNRVVHEEKHLAQQHAVQSVPVLKYSNSMAHDGSYSYKYETADGLMREESSVMEPGEDGQMVASVRGSYSYPGPDGRIIRVDYVADEGGFRASGDHLPSSLQDTVYNFKYVVP